MRSEGSVNEYYSSMLKSNGAPCENGENDNCFPFVTCPPGPRSICARCNFDARGWDGNHNSIMNRCRDGGSSNLLHS